MLLAAQLVPLVEATQPKPQLPAGEMCCSRTCSKTVVGCGHVPVTVPPVIKRGNVKSISQLFVKVKTTFHRANQNLIDFSIVPHFVAMSFPKPPFRAEGFPMIRGFWIKTPKHKTHPSLQKKTVGVEVARPFESNKAATVILQLYIC